ncbi:WxL domain-containing protein [Enterococcus sp. DIV0756]|uniref:WxL domain-containing protein n=1 Tax=Enterococcus sp. DIV0756 TaxID=2774636 RepID=UPI003F291285
MKILSKKFAKIGFLLVLLGSFGISQEVQAAPITPINFTRNLALDFDIKLYDGSAYNDAQVLVDIEDENWNPLINNVRAQNIAITPTNGRYYHSYGMFDIGNWFDYLDPLSQRNYGYIYYTNLRVKPKKYIKTISLGSVKTFHSDGRKYNPDWTSILTYENKDYPLPDANNKFTILGDGTHVWKESTFITSEHNRPTVEFASMQIGGGFGNTNGVYHTTSYNLSGQKIHFVATPYQVKENFVDDSGVTITPPSGFTQGKLTYANAEQYTHTLNPVPTSYTTGGKKYMLKGSYKGPTKPGTLNQANPPSITVDYTDSSVLDFDQESQITVVYSLAAKLTEKYVDESGVQIDATWDPSAPQDVEKDVPFTIPHTIGDTKTDSMGDSWEYVGWKYDTDPAGTKRTTATTGNIPGDTTIEYIYKLSKTTASLDLTPTPKIVNNNSNVSWTSRLTNTGNAPLKDLILKSTSNWSTGLENPVQVTVTPAGGSAQTFSFSPSDWATGVNLTGITIPNGGLNNYADITFTTMTTNGNAVNQVLPAEIEVAGNIPTPVTAENFVRIDDPDEPNLEPLGNAGLINIPNFKFGEVEVKPFAQTKKLDTTAYQSGYHPYIRFMDMESNGNWSLTAKLDQFKSGTKTLPTTTTIKLKNGVLMEVQNYNKHNENFANLVLAGSVSIPSDNNSVAFTNGTNQGVYQLEYDSNGVELELMAHSGIAGLSYQADMEWTLTTAP